MAAEVDVLKPARNVLITGASSGIGAATATHLAECGLRVFGTSRTPRSPATDASGLRWLALDVCDDASVDAAVATMAAEVDAIEAVVCNAGVGIFGSVEETPIEAARAQFETNYFGVLRILRAVLPGMRSRGRGRVALVGSLAGRAPIPFQSHYSSSKAAIDALALALRNEVGPLGIGVSLIEPGDIDTPFNEAMDWGAVEDSAYAARIERCERQIREQLPRAPKPVVVARAIEHALTARRPRVRYAVGDSSWLVPIGRRLLPDVVSLDLIRRTFKV
jgi:NAD(P)-dependent dehydrogenase (short-subunit alcohol dehydrogenase family)